MEEVVEMLSEKHDSLMAKATANFFKNLSERIKRPKKRPDGYIEVFKLLNVDQDQ